MVKLGVVVEANMRALALRDFASRVLGIEIPPHELDLLEQELAESRVVAVSRKAPAPIRPFWERRR